MSQVAEWIDAAIHNDDPRPLITLGDVMVDVMQNRAAIMQGQRSCMVTRIADYETTGERVMEAWLAGGDMGEIIAAVPQLEQIARASGCTQAMVTGRRGWERMLKPYGYAYSHTVLRKLLTHG